MNKHVILVLLPLILTCSFPTEDLFKPYNCDTVEPPPITIAEIAGYWIDTTSVRVYPTDTAYSLLVLFNNKQYYFKTVPLYFTNTVYCEEFGDIAINTYEVRFHYLKAFRIFKNDNGVLDTIIDTNSTNSGSYSKYFLKSNLNLTEWSWNNVNPDCATVRNDISYNPIDSSLIAHKMWNDINKPE